MAKFQSRIGQAEIQSMAKARMARKLEQVASSSWSQVNVSFSCDHCGRNERNNTNVLIDMEVTRGSRVKFHFCEKCWDNINFKVHEETAAIEKRAEEDKRKITYPPFLATKRYTPEQLQDYVIYDLEHDIEQAEKELAGFNEKFMSDPEHTFSWADDYYKKAAQHKVAKFTLMRIKEHGLDIAVRQAFDQALSGARWPQHSTSSSSNLMHQEMTSAWAEMVCKLAYNPSEKEA